MISDLERAQWFKKLRGQFAELVHACKPTVSEKLHRLLKLIKASQAFGMGIICERVHFV